MEFQLPAAISQLVVKWCGTSLNSIIKRCRIIKFEVEDELYRNRISNRKLRKNGCYYVMLQNENNTRPKL